MSTGYGWSNAWTHARRRLELLEQYHDPATIRRATQLGVREGWACLEAGAGAGSIARWLSRQVRKSGHVLAVDVDTELLLENTPTNMDVQRLDLRADPLPSASFDFVHARAVLTHVAERAEVLAKLVDALRPGGLLLLEELDGYPSLATATGSYRRSSEAMVRVAETFGADFHRARNLPSELDAVGLVDVGAEQDIPLVRGSSPWTEWARLSLLQARHHDVAADTPGDVIDAAVEALADPEQWFHGLALAAGWGRRPGGF